MQKISYGPVPSPTTYGGCQLWLDAADPTTFTLSGSNVSQWNDKSSNAYVAIGSSGLYPTYTKTINGLNVLTSSSGQSLNITNFNQSFTTGTVFCVLRPVGDLSPYSGYPIYTPINGTVLNSIQFIFAYYSGLGYYAQLNRAGNVIVEHDYGFSSSGLLNTLLLYSAAATGNTGTNFLNAFGSGLSLQTNTTYTFTTTSYMTLNVAACLNGAPSFDLAEVIVYDNVLSTTVVKQIEGYLAQKWGLTANLPSGHPGLTQSFYIKNPGIATVPTKIMTNTPYPTISPINLGGTGACQLWLDAADLSSLTVTGTTVTRWNDKSGNGYYASSNTGTVTSTTNLINGNNSIFFPAFSALSIKNSGGTISFSVGSAITIFVVAQGVGNITTQNSGYFFFSNGSFLGYGTGNIAPANLSVTFYHISSYFMASVQNSVEVDYTVTTSTYNTPNIFAYNPQIGTATFNGTVYSAATQTLPSGSYDQYIGGPRADSYAYQLGEIIIYNTPLATPQRQQVEGYLAWKWGLQANLINTHPYYNGPPGRPSQVAGIPLVKQMTHPTVPGYYPFYQVDSNTWTTSWLPYLQQLVAANANATANTTLGTITGTLVGFYVASFLAPNGLIYLMDNTNNPMGVITPTANGGVYSSTTVTGVGPYTQYGDNYKGGGLASNGIIYLVNFESIGIGTINTNTNVYTNNPYNANPGAAAVTGGVLAPDGNIYCSPYVDTSHIYYFTPGANTLSSFSISASIRYCKPFLAPNGKIYCLGIGTKVVGVIDPVAKTFTEVGTCANQQYCFMVLGGNGVVYAFPLNATGIGTLDLTTNIVTANVISGGTGYYGGILGPDGNIYLYQSSAGNIGVLNTKTNTLSVLTTTTIGYLCGVLAPNGNIYLSGNSVIVFSGVTQTPTLNFCLTPNLNNGADRY